MKTITLQSENAENLRLVRELAEKLNITVIDNPPEEPYGKRIAKLFEQWHKEGGMVTSVEDPVAWQREIRKDRKLPFRD